MDRILKVFILVFFSCLVCFSGANTGFGKEKFMDLREIKKNHRLIDLFIELAETPSPSLKEEKLAKQIMETFNIYGINAKYDDYGNIIAKIPASANCKNVPSLLLSAHMDVVGGSEEVNIKLSNNERFIETDKTRTLGADNKVGVAAIIDLARELNDLGSNIEHGPIEIVFTRDEEKGMTGIKNLSTSLLNSKYAIICDGEYLGELDVEGAGYTNVFISIHGGKGGHSGININDKTRVNAIKVLSELDSKIPQGVYESNERGVITSINAGANSGGAANTFIAELVKEAYQMGKEKQDIPEKYNSHKILETLTNEASTNIINTEACQSYSVRSSNPVSEQRLLEEIKQQVSNINKKYNGFINADIKIETHLKPFVKSNDTVLVDTIIKAAEETGLKSNPGSFHAGAETHVFANEKKNSKGESFIPVIIGLANLENIHSSDEKLDWKSFLTGRKWLESIVVNFAKQSQ